MAERTLTPRELNRAVLARQLLLERSSLPLFGRLDAGARRALEGEAERLAALHA